MEKKGIELLKKAIIEIIDVVEVAHDKFKDGTQWSDAIPIAMELKDLYFIFTKWGELKAEFEDLDKDEITELAIKIAEEIGIGNEELRDVILRTIKVLIDGYELVVAIKALKKE